MARKTKIIRIEDEKSRDNGKAFLITEKSLYDAEFWAMRAIGGMISSGVDIPDVKETSMEVLLHYGMASLMKIEPSLLKELVDEMLECVQVIPNPYSAPRDTRGLLPGDIEDLSTLLKLRMESILVHVDFFTNGGDQNTGS